MNANSSGSLLKPRRGSVLRVLIIVRISTLHQDARSLDDQAALCQRYVREPTMADPGKRSTSSSFRDRAAARFWTARISPTPRRPSNPAITTSSSSKTWDAFAGATAPSTSAKCAKTRARV